MDYRIFEQRLLETIFTTDIPITPTTIAYLYKISSEQAADFLQQAAIAGILNVDNDEQGNLLYTYPNRIRLTPRIQGGYSIEQDEHWKERSYPEESFSSLAQLNVTTRPLRSTSVYSEQEQTEDGVEKTEKKEEITPCPFCHEMILVGSKKCRFCYEYLDYSLREIYGRNRSKHFQPIVYQGSQTNLERPTTTAAQASLLSFFMPGLGQMCNGQIASGVLWMLFTCLGYVCFIIPGIVLHVLCVINASKQPQLQG